MALHLEKSVPAVAAIIAALRRGIAYVPIDPRLPTRRKKALLDAVRPDLLLDNERLPCESTAIPRLVWSDELRQPTGTSHTVSVSPRTPAYYLFTSGSTGTPKVVEISQEAALAFPLWAAETFSLGPGDVTAGVSALHFDLSTFDLFATLGSGAKLVLTPPNLQSFPAQFSQFLETHRVTALYGVPSTLSLLARSGKLPERDLSALRLVLSAGDVFSEQAAQDIHSISGCRVFNLYGPTETNVCTALEWKPELSPMPIGVPVAGDSCAVVREDLSLAGIGETGELVVSGPTLMTGYFDDPEATAKAFLDLEGRRAYRTGDLVRRDASGIYHFAGRASGMLKCYGHRIHPAEVEYVLRKHPAVRDCAVIGIEDALAGQIPHGLVVLAPEYERIPEDSLLEHLGAELPPYMIPHAFTSCDELPYNANGKIDRRLARRLLGDGRE